MSKRVLFPLVIAVALLAGCGKKEDGKLSNSEMKEAAQDIVQLAQGAQAGDPTTANFAYEPKTKFGKDFKTLFVKSAGVEKTMKDVLASVNLEKILSPERLTSEKGIEQSKSDLKKLDEASVTYYDNTGKVAVEMIDLVSRAAGSTPDGAEVILKETRDIAAKSAGLWAICKKVLGIAEEGHPTLGAGNMLVFAKDADIKRYNDAMAELQKIAAEHDKFIADTLQARQVRFASGMSKLNSIK